ncbi:MAG: PDZ domain-containing protein, partial [Planctomycetota bacterium]
QTAVPALRAAAYDPDAERALAARRLLLEADRRRRAAQGDLSERTPLAVFAFVYFDWARGVYFQIDPKGRVVLTAPWRDEKTGKLEFHRFEADSLDAFRERFPGLLGRFGLERFVHPPRVEPGDREWWAHLERWLAPEPSPDTEEQEEQDGPAARLEAWRARHRALLERFLRDWKKLEPENRPDAGALLGEPEAALRAHLGLKDDRGVLVLEVREGSAAERAGLRRHDVIAEVDGRPAASAEKVTGALTRALRDRPVRLEVLRGGRRVELRFPEPAGTP